MEREMNILIAVSGSDESVLEPIRRSFESSGIKVGRCDLRTTKNMILTYLNAYPDTDAVVLSQYQGNTMFSAADVDAISTVGNNIRVIVIVEEKAGSDYLKELESRGIYTAVYESNADYETIAKLIVNGRSKKDARIYYGVSGGDSKVTMPAFDTNNAVLYLSSYDGTIGDLTKRYTILSDRLASPSALLDVLAALPDDLFQMTTRIERYAALCNLVEERRCRSTEETKATDVPEPEESPKQETRRKKEKKERPPKKKAEKKKKEKREHTEKNKVSRAEVLNMEGRRNTVDVAFLATNIGVGCTTSAILFAHSVADAKKGVKVAIVEIDNADGDFETLCRVVTGERNTSGLTNFSLGGVDYYFNISYSKFGVQYKPLYDIVVYDFGCCSNEDIEHYVMKHHTKFVVGGAKEWHFGELAEFIAEVSPIDITDSLIYLFPCVDEKQDMGALQELIPSKNLLVCVPYEPNPYAPSKGTKKLFQDLLHGKWKQKTYKRVFEVEEKVHIKGRASISSIMLGSLTCALVIMVFLCIYLRESSVRAYNDLQAVAIEKIEEANQTLSEKNAEIEHLQGELTRLDMEICVLGTDVTAGQEITSDMIEKKVVKCGIDASLFADEEDISEKAAVMSIGRGIPIMDYMLAEPLEEMEEIPEELMHDGE